MAWAKGLDAVRREIKGCLKRDPDNILSLQGRKNTSAKAG
jgi:hypothetical protein